MNRSSKDLSQMKVEKDKENTTPPSSSSGPPVETPIWAQFSTTAKQRDSRPSTRDSNKSTSELKDEIAKYTPEVYRSVWFSNMKARLERVEDNQEHGHSAHDQAMRSTKSNQAVGASIQERGPVRVGDLRLRNGLVARVDIGSEVRASLLRGSALNVDRLDEGVELAGGDTTGE